MGDTLSMPDTAVSTINKIYAQLIGVSIENSLHSIVSGVNDRIILEGINHIKSHFGLSKSWTQLEELQKYAPVQEAGFGMGARALWMALRSGGSKAAQMAGKAARSPVAQGIATGVAANATYEEAKEIIERYSGERTPQQTITDVYHFLYLIHGDQQKAISFLEEVLGNQQNTKDNWKKYKDEINQQYQIPAPVDELPPFKKDALSHLKNIQKAEGTLLWDKNEAADAADGNNFSLSRDEREQNRDRRDREYNELIKRQKEEQKAINELIGDSIKLPVFPYEYDEMGQAKMVTFQEEVAPQKGATSPNGVYGDIALGKLDKCLGSLDRIEKGIKSFAIFAD